VTAKADPTGRIARAVRGLLEPGEDVVLAVKVQRPGTHSAQLEGAATGAISGATDTPYAARGGTDPDHARWLEQAVSLGIAPEAAQRVIHLFLVITSSRVLLVRRSRLMGRAQELIAAWPRTSLRASKITATSHTVQLEVDGAPLHLELPKAAKHLPAAYREIAGHLAG